MLQVNKKPQDYFNQVKEQQEIERSLKKSVDYTEIFTVLYDLFKKQGILEDVEPNDYREDTDKLSFSFSHPIASTDSNWNCKVVFDIVKRVHLTYETSAGPIKQEKPRQVATYFDTATGQRKVRMSYSYMNDIELTVIASSNEKMYEILKYLETTLTRDKGILLTRFTKLLYSGIHNNGITTINTPWNRPVYSKTICFSVVTETAFTLLHEEIQQINF